MEFHQLKIFHWNSESKLKFSIFISKSCRRKIYWNRRKVVSVRGYLSGIAIPNIRQIKFTIYEIINAHIQNMNPHSWIDIDIPSLSLISWLHVVKCKILSKQLRKSRVILIIIDIFMKNLNFVNIFNFSGIWKAEWTRLTLFMNIQCTIRWHLRTWSEKWHKLNVANA